MQVLETSDVAVSDNLVQIFKVLRMLNPVFFEKKDSFELQTQLEFPRNWGLGSSSTLIYALAKWTNVDPYALLAKTMGGSGYDIACAGVNHPILFERSENQICFEKVEFQPPFAAQLYFVFLGKKQNSRDGIARYRARIDKNHVAINYFTQLTYDFLAAKNINAFEKVIVEHEQLIARLLDLPRAKDLYFADYQGEIKSLGAWGGDFVLATSEMSDTETKAYFNKKGFETVIPYNKMVII
jgi:mevalonate kinase